MKEALKNCSSEPKITVGLTISPSLLVEARKRNLNLSRILEQALQSIFDYILPKNASEASIYQGNSSEFLTRGSFQKETLECRGPGLNRRQPGLQLRPQSRKVTGSSALPG
jgi:hypothetical protein